MFKYFPLNIWSESYKEIAFLIGKGEEKQVYVNQKMLKWMQILCQIDLNIDFWEKTINDETLFIEIDFENKQIYQHTYYSVVRDILNNYNEGKKIKDAKEELKNKVLKK